MPRAIIYLRVSTDEQAESGLGLEAQLSAGRAAAERLGLAIASIHQDDVSGGLPLDRRPVLVEAIAALEPGDVLLVAKRDRLSRGDMLATGTIELAVQRSGARIVGAAGERTESDDYSRPSRFSAASWRSDRTIGITMAAALPVLTSRRRRPAASNDPG